MPTIETEPFEYRHADLVFDAAAVAYQDLAPQRPAVLVFHGIEGRSEAQDRVAHRLAGLGYLGVAVDLFGREATEAGQQRRTDLMEAFLRDRARTA